MRSTEWTTRAIADPIANAIEIFSRSRILCAEGQDALPMVANSRINPICEYINDFGC